MEQSNKERDTRSTYEENERRRVNQKNTGDECSSQDEYLQGFEMMSLIEVGEMLTRKGKRWRGVDKEGKEMNLESFKRCSSSSMMIDKERPQ